MTCEIEVLSYSVSAADISRLGKRRRPYSNIVHHNTAPISVPSSWTTTPRARVVISVGLPVRHEWRRRRVGELEAQAQAASASATGTGSEFNLKLPLAVPVPPGLLPTDYLYQCQCSRIFGTNSDATGSASDSEPPSPSHCQC